MRGFHLEYSFIKHIIFFEIALVVLLVLVTCCARIFYMYKDKRDKRVLLALNEYIEKEMHNQAATYPNSATEFPLLLPTIQKYDQNATSSKWQEIKNKFLNKLKPLAEKKYNNRAWYTRMFAAQTFALLPSQEVDEEKLSKLLNDPIPIVRLNAAIVGVKIGTPNLINSIISTIAEYHRPQQTIYIKLFESADPKIATIIVERLKNDSDPKVKTVCYNLLKYLKNTQVADSTILADINSADLELRLSALRFYVYEKNEFNLEFLKQFLKDADWEMRVTAIQLIGDRHVEGAAQLIADCLSDSSWWVRVNAAKTLLSYREEGIHLLERQDPNKDLYAYEAAQHVLQMNKME